VTHYLIAAAWVVLGAALGVFVRWGSVRLAVLEELEPGHKPWQVYGPPVLSSVVFGIFALGVSPFPVLVVRSVFVLVLVQVIFFDFEHRLILDRVMFPAMGLAAIVSLFHSPWWGGLAMGLAAGLLFLVIALVGAAIFRTEALGFGDVKLALFLGLLLGWPYVFQGLLYGVFFAAVGAVVFIVWNRTLKGTIAYGPYLAAGALVMLFSLP